jgi:hypothetical protein
MWTADAVTGPVGGLAPGLPPDGRTGWTTTSSPTARDDTVAAFPSLVYVVVDVRSTVRDLPLGSLRVNDPVDTPVIFPTGPGGA